MKTILDVALVVLALTVLAASSSWAVRVPVRDDVIQPDPGVNPCEVPCPALDTDGDGTPDVDDSDDDGDGMTDVFEMEVSKTHPKRRDSDGDGAPDDEEYISSQLSDRGTDPNNDDTDGDGWTDGYEIEHFSNPVDPKHTPLSAAPPD